MIADGFVELFFPFRRLRPLGHLPTKVVEELLTEIHEQKNFGVLPDAEGVFKGMMFDFLKKDGPTVIEASLALRGAAAESQQWEMDLPVFIDFLNAAPDR